MQTPLDKKLKALNSLEKALKIKLALNPQYRNWGFVQEYFGQRNLSPEEYKKPVNINVDVPAYVAILKQGLIDECNRTISSRGVESENEKLTDGQGICTPENTISQGNCNGQGVSNKRVRSDSIFNPKPKGQSCELTTFESHGCEQIVVAQQLFDNIYYEDKRGQQLIGPPGSGKTFILGSLIKNLEINNFFVDCLSPYACLYITKASVVPQTQQDLKEFFGLDIHGLVNVINIEMIRAGLVGTLIEEETVVVNGEPQLSYTWRPAYRPKLIISDESQYYARPDSLQSQVGNAIFSDEERTPWKTYFVDSSGTPFSKIAEAKHFALATHGKLSGQSINLNTWPTLSADFARQYQHKCPDDSIRPATPDDYCPEAVAAFMREMEPYTVWITDFKPKKQARLSVNPMTLEDESSDLYKEYLDAEVEHHKRKARIEGDAELSAQQATFATLASYTIFAKAAENCHRYSAAKWINDTWNAGFAPTFCFNFKQTAVSIIRILLDDFNWTRDDISIIWGGSTEALTAKKKMAKKLKSDQAQELLKELDIDIEMDLGIFASDFKEKTEEQYNWEKANKLLSQKPDEREREKIRFLSQQSKVCFFTYKSGGVGLNLQHMAKYPRARPRRSKFIPDYSEKLGVQALYRTARLTSASDTDMWFDYYQDTIEYEKLEKFKMKCRSLKEVTRTDDAVWAQIAEDKAILDVLTMEF